MTAKPASPMPLRLLQPRHWPAWLTLLLLRMLVLLPLRWWPPLARVGGKAAGLLLRRRRQIAATNIRLCFPDLDAAARQKLVDEVMASTVYGILETACSWWAPEQRLRDCCTLEGSELLEQARREGRGVLLLGLHFTTLDLAGRLMRLHHDVDVTYRRQNNPVFDHFIEKYRARLFRHMIEKNEMRRLIRVLKQGRTVWYAIDQNYGRKPFVFAPLFGQPAATLASTGSILRMTGAKPLLFSHYRILRDGQPHYLLRISDPFGEQFSDNEQANANLLNRAYEAAIREHPGQYLWTHRRFKTRPPGLPPLYGRMHKRGRKPAR